MALTEIDRDVEARIAEGLIPPRPSDPAAFGPWFAKHLRCMTPTHRYLVRARGETVCAECLSHRRVSA